MDSEKTAVGSVLSVHQSIAPELQVRPERRQLQEEEVSQHCADAWERDCAGVEDKFFSALNALMALAAKEKIELKKPLAEIYKKAHELMTRYNQRVQSLILDDRFLYRHAAEISALMIRGLMPPLENIKSLEKSITSSRKKAANDSLPDLQHAARAELQKIHDVLRDVRVRLDRYTKPLSADKLQQKKLQQRLQQEASELEQQIQPAAVVTPPVREPISTKAQQAVPPSVDDLTSPQLQVLAERLDHPDGQKGVLAYVESEYEHFTSLDPFLSVAKQKCQLMSMNPDRACIACQEGIVLLEKTLANREAALSLAELMAIDRAIGKLTAFDKRLPGEVWQLFTELSPDQGDARHHLLNLLCRKLLLNGPALLTRKAILHQFKAIEQLLAMLSQEVEEAAFDQAFMAVLGQAFTSLAQLKKVLSVANKPHELQALLALFARRHNVLALSETLQTLSNPEDEAVRRGVAAGITAFEFLVQELPAQLALQIDDYRPFETNTTQGQLSKSMLAKFADYYQALELARKPLD